MTSKTPSARHRRFLAAGFFPPEVPPCFYSEQLALHKTALCKKFDKLPPTKKKEPHYCGYVSQKSTFGFPRYKKADRRHSIVNPISFLFLSWVLADNYLAIKKLQKKSKITASPSIFDWSGPRTLKRPNFESRDTFLSDVNARFEYTINADISSFYHSIYTHSIPWAIHGKAFAKKNRTIVHYGNLIDLLCRNAQDGQTIGLPVGPDTSRLIAELIATAVDIDVQKTVNSTRKSGARFVDDYTLGATSKAHAETAIATIRRASNAFELDLNSEKTFVADGVSAPAGGWKTYIRSAAPKPPYTAEQMETFVFVVEETSKRVPEVNIQKFALQNARRAIVDCTNWRFVENYLISVYKANATVIDVVVELIIQRHFAHNDVNVDLISPFINARLPLLCGQRRFGEAMWLLFLATSLNFEIPRKSIEGFFSEKDPVCAIMIADAKAKGLIKGKADYSTWNKSLTRDELDGDMWLYAYESTLKGLNKSNVGDGFVKSHLYFSELFARKIEFYRSGQGVFSLQETLRRRKIENTAAHKIAAQLSMDDADNLDDWDDEDIGDIY